MTAKKSKTTRRPAPRRSPAEEMKIWDDGEGGRTVAPTSARAHRAAHLGEGVAALHLDGDGGRRDELLARHAAAWRIERRDGTVTALVAYSGPAFSVAGATVQTSGTVDLGGAGAVREPGEVPQLRWQL